MSESDEAPHASPSCRKVSATAKPGILQNETYKIKHIVTDLVDVPILHLTCESHVA